MTGRDLACTYIYQRRCWAPPSAHDDGELGHRHEEPHLPGEPHRYRVVCDVCGEEGQVRISIEPREVPK